MGCTHSNNEATVKEFLENVFGSLYGGPEYKKIYDLHGTEDAVDTVLKLLACPYCSRRMKLISQEPYVVRYKKLGEGAKMPIRAHDSDVGWDLYALETTDLLPHQICEVRTGLALEMSTDLYCTLEGRSSWGSKGVILHRGIIDPDYRGHISGFMLNTTDTMLTVRKWERFAQLIFHRQAPIRFVVSDELTPSQRGEGRLGSTGR